MRPDVLMCTVPSMLSSANIIKMLQHDYDLRKSSPSPRGPVTDSSQHHPADHRSAACMDLLGINTNTSMCGWVMHTSWTHSSHSCPCYTHHQVLCVAKGTRDVWLENPQLLSGNTGRQRNHRGKQDILITASYVGVPASRFPGS